MEPARYSTESDDTYIGHNSQCIAKSQYKTAPIVLVKNSRFPKRVGTQTLPSHRTQRVHLHRYTLRTCSHRAGSQIIISFHRQMHKNDKDRIHERRLRTGSPQIFCRQLDVQLRPTDRPHSRQWKIVHVLLGVCISFKTTYHQQTNVKVETFNRNIFDVLRAYITDQARDWDLRTSALTYAYNTQPQSSTSIEPFDLVLSKPPGVIAASLPPT